MPISDDGLRTLLGLAVMVGLLLQVVVFLLLAFTQRWLPLLVGLGALATEPWSREFMARSRLRILGNEVFEWLVVAYIVFSTPLVIGALQLGSFLALTITQLSLFTLSRRTRDRETANAV